MIKPYYENPFGKLYQGNCLDIMKELDMKFDLVLTDPPYNMTACSWDKEIIDLKKFKKKKFLTSLKDMLTLLSLVMNPFQPKLEMLSTMSTNMIVFGLKTLPHVFSTQKICRGEDLRI